MLLDFDIIVFYANYVLFTYEDKSIKLDSNLLSGSLYLLAGYYGENGVWILTFLFAEISLRNE